MTLYLMIPEKKKAHIGRKEICRNGTGVKGKDILTDQNAHESEKITHFYPFLMVLWFRTSLLPDVPSSLINFLLYIFCKKNCEGTWKKCRSIPFCLTQ